MKDSDKKQISSDDKALIHQASEWMLGSSEVPDAVENPNSELDEQRLAETSPEKYDKYASSIEGQGEQQLMHALLLRQSESEDDVNAFVERGMEKLNQLESRKRWTKIPIFGGQSYNILGGLAASFVVGVFIVFLAYPSNSAMAAMNKVINHIETMGDRFYTLHVEKIKHGKNTENKESDAKIRFERADLYLRDEDKFVFIEYREGHEGPVKGSDGKHSWKIGPDNTLVTDAPGSIKIPLSNKARGLVFMDLAASLNHLKSGYNITMEENRSLPGVDGQWTKILAEKIDRKTKGAKRVAFYFDPETYRIQQLVFDRVHLSGDRKRVKITMDLQSIEPLPDKFFEPAMHDRDRVEE